MSGMVQGMGSTAAAVLGSQERIQHFRRTRLCKFNLSGVCARGESCNFAHGMTDLTEQPDYSKTRLCAGFVALGKCANGANCKFAHGKQDLKPRSDATPKPKPKPTAMSTEEACLIDEALLMQLMQLTMALKLQGHRHPTHDQAMMSLLLQSIAPKVHPKLRQKLSETDEQDGLSEIHSTKPSFSRSTSAGSGEATAESLLIASSSAEQPILAQTSQPEEDNQASREEKDRAAGKKITVKNTFIHVESVKATMRRSHSMPQLQFH